VITIQRAIWGQHFVTIRGGQTVVALPDASQWWYLRNLGILFGISVGLLFFAFWVFGRLEDNLSENI
jgi:hypothetical protein